MGCGKGEMRVNSGRGEAVPERKIGHRVGVPNNRKPVRMVMNFNATYLSSVSGELPRRAGSYLTVNGIRPRHDFLQRGQRCGYRKSDAVLLDVGLQDLPLALLAVQAEPSRLHTPSTVFPPEASILIPADPRRSSRSSTGQSIEEVSIGTEYITSAGPPRVNE